MLQIPRARLFLSVALVGLALLLLPAVASADTVTNNVGTNATVSFSVDSTVTVSYQIMAKNNDGLKRCNAQDGSLARLTIKVTPADRGVTVSPSSLEFDSCKTLLPVTFSVPPEAQAGAQGNYTVTVSVADAGPGNYTTNLATIQLVVLPPTDIEAPVVNVNFPSPPHGWFVVKPVMGTVVATDQSKITSLECTGGTVTGLTGIGSTSVAASVVVDAEGYSLVICLARDEQNHYGAGLGSKNTARVPIDTEGPLVQPWPDRDANAAGWYNSRLTINFDGDDDASGVNTCSRAATYSGPDSADASVSGTCTDEAGNEGTGTFTFKYDATAPVATASADRAPDYKGAYVRPVVITFNGSDPGSGIASCTAPITYSGPAAASTSVSGTCIDNAGNTSDPATFALKFLKLVLLPLIRR